VAAVAGLGLAAAAPVTEAQAAAAPAVAAPGPPHIALSPHTGPPGTAIRVSGSGFATRETVRISLADQDHTVAQANRRGSFSGALVTVGNVAPGAYQVTAVGRRTGRQASATFTVHDNWAQYGAGPARTGWNVNEVTLSPSAVPGLGLAWRFNTSNEAFSSPAVVNGTAYVGSLSNAVYALNEATGAQRWMFRTYGAVNSSPAVLGGQAYVGSEGNRVYAIGVVHGIQRGCTAPAPRSSAPRRC
jgi:outer membrane protein assembly factor BamB